jgi:NAD(P)-dependent dehydrogenase (short-subunit alcohol dehydrogenase family)
MSLVSMLMPNGSSGFGYGSTAEVVTAGLDLTGKTVLITGVNSGLGLESARVLALRGARIIGAARTAQKASEALQGLPSPSTHVGVACELSEPASVRTCVDSVRALGMPIDVLLCNAGIMALPERTLKYGQELQFLTNHVGHFILVTGLLDAMTPKGRVVVLSSGAHRGAPSVGIQFDDLTFASNYSPWRAYGQSKLANLLFARALSKRLAGSGKTANSVHPGVIRTNLGRHMNPVLRVAFPIGSALAFKSVEEGAATQCFVATHPSLDAVTGEYFVDCNVGRPSSRGRDDALADRLYEDTERIVKELATQDAIG